MFTIENKLLELLKQDRERERDFNFQNCHLEYLGVGNATRGEGERGELEKEANLLQHLLGTLSHR